ncbi:ATP-binding cassette transporter snq2, partial [Dimargaris xerosporica]
MPRSRKHRQRHHGQDRPHPHVHPPVLPFENVDLNSSPATTPGSANVAQQLARYSVDQREAPRTPMQPNHSSGAYSQGTSSDDNGDNEVEPTLAISMAPPGTSGPGAPQVLNRDQSPERNPPHQGNSRLPSKFARSATVPRHMGSKIHRYPSYNFPNTVGDVNSGVAFGEPTQVDYEDATQAYEEVGRTYSQLDAGPSAQQQPIDQGRALEKGEPLFDIREHLAQRVEGEVKERQKDLGLVFSNLSVYGNATGERHIEKVYSPLVHTLTGVPKFVWRLITFQGLANNRSGPTKPILHNVNGYVRPGEMLLILGKPGAGCSTLLRALGNQRQSYRAITGEVSYGGVSPKEMHKHYRGEVVYNQEEDCHFATISVRDTISFALKAKTPSTRVVTNRGERNRQFTDMLIRMFGLRRCANTRVGNAMLRGVSGGEKKRTSIAEQMATAAAITMWDGSTKGLDASSALDYVKSLRIVADLLHRTTAVTLYQASENIYNVFDKVMVLAKGRCIFFGPAQEAKTYFTKMGYVCPDRQTTSDFLTGITSEHEALVAPGMEHKVPHSPEEFEDRFRKSPEYDRLMQEIDEYDHELKTTQPGEAFRHNINAAKMGAGNRKYRATSPYLTTYWFQVLACLRREVSIILGNPMTLIFRLTYTSCMAIIVGSLFFKLSEDSDGAFTRSGVLFFALLFSTLVTQSEIPKCFANRP